MKSSPAILLALALTFAAQAADDKKAVDPAVAAATQKVNATGASLMPIAADAKAYRFTALNVAKEFTDAGLDALTPIADKIASLDLARTKVTDAGLAKLAAMKGLKELHLENTAISDAGLDHLKGLAELEYLNLYNTKVTDAGLPKLTSLGKLKSLYLWQSGVTKAGVTALKAKLPNAHVNSGWTAEDDAKPTAIVAAAPPAAPAAAKPAADATKPAAAPAPAPAPAAPAAGGKLDPALAAKAVIYKDVVASIMQAKCVSCHGEEKKKGKLQLHTYAAIIKGGGDGATTVIPSNIKDSLLLVRANLPTDDDEHMPPSDEPQLTKEEVAILKWWIETGASETATVASVKAPADVEGALAVLLAKGLPKAAAAPAKEEKPKAKPLTDAEKKQVAEITAKMQALNASLMPLAQDTEQLRLGVVNAADKFGDKELALLLPIAQHIVWVDLARSQITDAAADTLAKMASLERLHLENTKVTDAGIAKLGALPALEYLNLYGTKTTDGGIAKLSTAKGLKKLFVWQTAVTQNGAKALEAQVPGLKVNVGLTEAEIAKLTAPPPAPPAPPPAAKKEEPKKADPAKKEEPKKDEPKKEEPKKATTTPAPAAGNDLVKTIMKQHFKPDDGIAKKAGAGTSTDAELATLLKACQDMLTIAPPKGDKAAYVMKTQGLIDAVKKVQAKDAAGPAAYKAAVNCKACHTDHKGA